MTVGSRREESIDQGQGIGNSKQRPGSCDRLIDGQHAIPKPRPHLREPSIERFCLLRIAPPFQLDATTDFGEHEDARSDFLDRSTSDPTDNVGMGSIALADFGNDIGVDQKFHRSTLRQFRWRGCSKTPAKASSGSSGPNISHAVYTSGAARRFAWVNRRASASSASPRNGSANARMRPASLLGAWTSTRTKPRAAARRRCVRIALRWDLLAIRPALGYFRLYSRKSGESQEESLSEYKCLSIAILSPREEAYQFPRCFSSAGSARTHSTARGWQAGPIFEHVIFPASRRQVTQRSVHSTHPHSGACTAGSLDGTRDLAGAPGTTSADGQLGWCAPPEHRGRPWPDGAPHPPRPRRARRTS